MTNMKSIAINRATMKKSANDKTVASFFNVNENLSLEEQIAARAHELWQRRDKAHGNDMADWFQAEREINDWHQKRLAGKM